MRSIFTRRGFLALLLVVAFLFPVTAEAANKFWVGGTGNLDGVTTTNISDTSGGAGGATYPAVGDSLTFDANSGGGTVTVTAPVSMTNWTSSGHSGTIDTNGQSITLSGSWIGSGTGVRSITLGASVISVGSWTFNTITNLTFNAGTSSITMTGNTFAGGGLAYATVVLNNAGGVTISGANTFSTLTRTPGAAVKTSNLFFAGDQTISGTLTIDGNSSVNRILVGSNVLGTARVISAGTITTSNSDWKDITGAGAGSWNLSAITGLSGDCGGNTSITFTSPVTNYWIGGTGNWDAVAEWASTSGGSASSGRVPLCQDAARFDANSFNAGSQTVTQNMTRIGSVDWTGVTNTPAFNSAIAYSIFGSITLVSGMTANGSTQVTTVEGRGACTFDFAGLPWDRVWTIDAASGSVGLLSAFSTTRAFTVTSGTFSDGGFNVTASNFTSTGSATRAVTMGSGNTWTLTGDVASIWNVAATGMTLNPGTSTIRLTSAMSAARTFAGAGLTYHRLENATSGAFALQVTGSNTFGTASTPNGGIYIDASAAARDVLFTAGTTTTVTRMGRLDSTTNTITLGSITAAGHTIARASGSPYKTVIENLSVSRSTVTANAFYAPGGTDGGNNSNWVFGHPPRGAAVQ